MQAGELNKQLHQVSLYQGNMHRQVCVAEIIFGAAGFMLHGCTLVVVALLYMVCMAQM